MKMLKFMKLLEREFSPFIQTLLGNIIRSDQMQGDTKFDIFEWKLDVRTFYSSFADKCEEKDDDGEDIQTTMF